MLKNGGKILQKMYFELIKKLLRVPLYESCYFLTMIRTCSHHVYACLSQSTETRGRVMVLYGLSSNSFLNPKL